MSLQFRRIYYSYWNYAIIISPLPWSCRFLHSPRPWAHMQACVLIHQFRMDDIAPATLMLSVGLTHISD
jgi:hypothetical protein